MNLSSRALLGFVCLPLLLSGCASKEKAPVRRCPQVAIVRDLAIDRDYGANPPDEKELVAAAGMKDFDGGCSYSDKGVDVNVTLNMIAAKGPRLGGDNVGFPFFVSLLDGEDKILKKEMMMANFTFPTGKKNAEHKEDLHVFVPLPDDKTNAEPYRVLFGFQLTEEQLKDVRSAKEALFEEMEKKGGLSNSR